MARFAIKGMRPGESLYCGSVQVQTDERDGGVRLTEKQQAALEDAGYTLIPLADEPIAEKAPSDDELRGQERAEANSRENQSAAANAEVSVPSKEKLAPKKR